MIRLLAPTAQTHLDPVVKMIQPYTATVRREEGGAWELTATMAADELDMLAPGADQAILVADTPEGWQPFRIRYVERDGPILTVRAPHQFFDADGVLVTKISETAKTAAYVLDAVLNEPTLVVALPWSHTEHLSSLTATKSYATEYKTLTEAINEVATTYGFYVRPDGFSVDFTTHRGDVSGYALVYGANLQEASVSYDWEDVMTDILAIGENDITVFLQPTPAPGYAAPHYVGINYDTGIEKLPSETDAQYRGRVQAALTTLASRDLSKHLTPAINYTVTGYVAPDAQIKLGDSALCIDSRYGLNLNMACVGYDYDPEQHIYNSVEFGSIRKNLRALRPKS